VLTQAGPGNGLLVTSGEAAARWRAPDGHRRWGWLTTTTAPDIGGAPAGARVQVWLTRSGEPEAPPPGPWEAGFASVMVAIGAACCAGILLIICYWLCRLALDRRRLAAWASEWSVAGPRWTTRR
jgi:ABC-type Fe3+ transport system permease subunit